MMAQMPADRPDPSPQCRGTSTDEDSVTVLFVCTGNICRSPMAEVALRAIAARTPLRAGGTLADVLVVDSAGTSRWHEGSEMDPRARKALDDAGMLAPGSAARQVSAQELASWDLVVALDRGHRAELRQLAPGCDPVVLRSFSSDGAALDVPDPYYGDDEEFAACLAQVVSACEALALVLADRGP